MKRIITLLLGTCLLLFAAAILSGTAACQTVPLNSFAQMPSNSTLLLINNGGLWPPFGPDGLSSALASYGTSMNALEDCSSPVGFSAFNWSIFSDPTSLDFPSGDTIIFSPMCLKFAQPVYAIGATFIATPAGVDPNLPDVVFRVQGTDANGNILGSGYSSSFTQSNGPRGIHVLVGNPGYEFMTSFAGIWSATPIAQAVINVASGASCPAGCRGDWSAFAFSNTPLYQTSVQQPINSDGSSIFKANRGVIPVKFTLIQNGSLVCALPPATIAVTRIAGATPGPIDESTYLTSADSGSNFRIDLTACQYVYNIAASSLGVGTYDVDLNINGLAIGHAVFALK